MADPYRAAYEKVCQELRSADPQVVAGNADIEYRVLDGGGLLTLPFFGRAYTVAFPALEVRDAQTGQTPPLAHQILMLHHLKQADGAPPTGQWVSFRLLPDGRVYERAFRARALEPLARTFGGDAQAFQQAARKLGGEPMRLGDVSYLFRVFPRLFLAVVIWLGDEEFPPEANILFDSTAGHYLPTEDLAVVGGMLSGRLVKEATKGD
ncbi:MAG: DUF3786 domain-containing protein [Chloroflexota bacterium]